MWLINWVTMNWKEVTEIVVGLVGVMAIVATMTPNNSDDEFVKKIQGWINILGANFGKSKNDPKV